MKIFDERRHSRPSLLPVSILAATVGSLLLLVAALALWSGSVARGGAEALKRSAAIQSAALTFLGRLEEAEAGQRGYLLSGQRASLAPYERAMTRVPGELERLVAATAQDPDQQRRVRRVEELLGRKVEELARTVALVNDNRRADAAGLVSTEGGQDAMDDIRLVVTRILSVEDEKAILRESELEAWYRLSTRMIALAALAALVMTVAALVLVRRQFASSGRLRVRLADLNQELEATVAHRTREAETARAQAIAEKDCAQNERRRVELLLQDMNHRVGNNLAMVSGMLNLQISSAGEEIVKRQLRAAQTRISTIANAQRRLRLGSDLSTVRGDEIVENAMADLTATMGAERHVYIETSLDAILVDNRDAIHLAILANEIATNAVKHAFHDREHGGRIMVSLRLDEDNRITLAVEDDGVGMRDGSEGGGGLGRKLVARLARQFGGEVQVRSEAGGGTRVVVPLPNLGATAP